MMRFHVPDMVCGGCVRSITRALAAAAPGAVVEADLERHEVVVRGAATAAAVADALARAGFAATLRDP